MEVKRSIYLFKFIIIIPGYIAAQRDAWLVGDNFLDEVFYAFTKLKDEAKDSQQSGPYLYQYYNITCSTENNLSSNDDTMARIVNSVINKLNEPIRKLPRFIIIIPDRDLLRHINYLGYGISHILGSCLNWIIKKIDDAIHA